MSHADWCQRWAHLSPHNTLTLSSSSLRESVCQPLKPQHLGRRLAWPAEEPRVADRPSAPPWRTLSSKDKNSHHRGPRGKE